MPTEPSISTNRGSLSARFAAVRRLTDSLCQPLEIEDYQLQSMPDCSPPKWHLAHTTWFFETFILERYEPSFRPYHASYRHLFNSYYEAVGERWPRPARGLLSRPTLRDVLRYRHNVEDRVAALLGHARLESEAEIESLIDLGINHEQQHQELLLTDLKHAFGLNPLSPVYARTEPHHVRDVRGGEPAADWIRHDAGLRSVGHDGDGFAFDNERPRHRVYLEGFRIASRLVTAGEYREFIQAGGYDRPEFWLSDGWAARQRHGWTAPLYWTQEDRGWTIFTLSGPCPLDASAPVCHISYYEADAFARWAGARLPTEAEWETAAASQPIDGNLLDRGCFHPVPTGSDAQFFGDAWVWTASPYVAYPGYRPAPGALGEYNGKFMCNQMVLRGGSCVTPRDHIRATYRNFFPPDARWQFSGLRLAKDEPA
jgi:ergothioneine biosynthesis protein EgtB